jgi:RNA polymerase sigma-70 factor (ECF subfamily)
MIYKDFSPKMYGICLRFAGNQMDADDILQEGFIKVYKNLKHFKNNGSFEGWIRKIIVNTAINYYKRKKRIAKIEESDYLEVSQSIDSDALNVLSEAELLKLIQELPNGYRTVFNLNVLEGYTHKEIGDMMGITDNTSKSQLARARRILQKKIELQSARKLKAPVNNLHVVENNNNNLVLESNLYEYSEAV